MQGLAVSGDGDGACHLRGQAEAANARACCLLQQAQRHGPHRPPPVLRVLFGMTGLRKLERVRLAGTRHDVAGAVHQRGLQRRGTEIVADDQIVGGGFASGRQEANEVGCWLDVIRVVETLPPLNPADWRRAPCPG